jgi:nitrogen fixation protein FixH
MSDLVDHSRGGGYRWFPWAIGASLGFVVAVNLALAYFAVNSSTGLVTEHPFESGNGYNSVLAEAAAEDALGWRAHLALSGTAAARHLSVALRDRAGAPLAGATVAAKLERPVEPAPAVPVAFRETAPGTYEADLPDLRAGQWEVHLVARRGDDLYQQGERIIVR